jgi:uncharacterized repeat protein (TIGR01451 family)
MANSTTPFRTGSGSEGLTRLQQVGIGAGLLALAVGFVALGVPDAVPSLPVQYVLVTLLGMVGLVLGLLLVRRRWRSSVVQDDPPDVELSLSGSLPGRDVDQLLAELAAGRRGEMEAREHVRERLVETAIGVLRQQHNVSRDEAITRLEQGDWTDDDEAAAFFTGQKLPGLSLGDRVENWLAGRTAYERRVQNVVDALARTAGLSPVEVEETEDEEWVGRRVADSLFRSVGASKRLAERNRQQASWDDDEVTYDYGGGRSRTTNRWLGVSAFALVAFGVGLMAYEPSLLVASAVGLAYAGYSRSGTPPDLSALEVRRELDEENPSPGERVSVTVQVRNAGDETLPDLRLVDAVPGPVTVVDGSPRVATPLRPGKTVSFSYEMVARRGEHEWPLYAVGRDASGEAEATETVAVDATLECVPRLDTTQSMPVRALTTLFTGEVATDSGGPGLEFHIKRQYQPNDPLSRVDWKHRAKTGEFATVDYREELSVNAVLLFDAREAAYLTPSLEAAHAVDRSVDAGAEIFASLFDRGDQVGVAAFDTIPCWLAPGASDEHRERARRLFTGHPALSSIPPTDEKGTGGYVDPLTHVRRQLSMHSQVFLFTPLCDDYSAEVAKQLDASGHPITLVSPDPTLADTVGTKLVRVERRVRLAALREQGIRVVDWPLDERLGTVLERTRQRW